MSNAVLEATWSDFLRDPKHVTDRLDAADVILRRRDADDVHLSSESRSQAESETVLLLSRLLFSMVNDADFRGRVRDIAVMPWQHFLSDADRSQFVEEFVETAAACADLGTLLPLSQLISEWRNTALVHADPALAQALRRTHPGDGGVVAPRRPGRTRT